MYLFIFEDGSIRSGNTLGEDDLQASDDGILTIIKPKDGAYIEYFNGEWLEVETYLPLNEEYQ